MTRCLALLSIPSSSSSFSFFCFLPLSNISGKERGPWPRYWYSISSWSSMTRARTRVCACVIYVFSRLSSVRAGSTLPPSPTHHHQHHLQSPSSNCPTKLFKNVCQRFGGGSPERQIELRSWNYAIAPQLTAGVHALDGQHSPSLFLFLSHTCTLFSFT